MNTKKIHDPLIVKDGAVFYCFATDVECTGVHIRKSTDLINWEHHKSALPGVPKDIARHTGANHMWAPEVIKVEDNYRLYFCASSFGTSQSAIGLAEATEIDGDYVYKGEVLRTYKREDTHTPNAIDPQVVTDRQGKRHLVYGSFFEGIFIAPLDDDGFLSCSGYGLKIAGGAHRAVEGAYIIYHQATDLFYLFVSYGSLAYDYNIRVATAKEVEGPYLDSRGHVMTDLDPVLSVGDKIAGGYNFQDSGEGFMGPGHNSILTFDGRHYLVHHIREQGNPANFFMQIREMYFLKNGQVILSPVPYNGIESRGAEIKDFTAQECTLKDSAVSMSFIKLDIFNNGVIYGVKKEISELSCKLGQRGDFEITIFGKAYFGKAFVNEQLYITAISNDGECLWGIEV